METWGGNRQAMRCVDLPGLKAWVYSSPIDAAQGGGDVHYLSVCNYGLLSRIALADVSGHGPSAAAFSGKLHALLREHINTWDQSDLMRELNQAFREAVNGRKYATAVILGYYRATGETAFTCAGHLPPLWYRAGARRWEFLEEGRETGVHQCGLPVGLIPGTRYHQTVIRIEPGDLVVLYTDGITEAENAAGEMLDRERLLDWARLAPAGSSEAAGQFLLQRLEQYRGSALSDDETLIVLQRAA